VGEGADTFGFASAVVLSDGYAFLADGTAGLAVVDVRDPAFPGVAGSCTLEGRALDLLVVDDTAYLATEASGLQLVSVSSPEEPAHLSTLRIPGSASGLSSVLAEDGILVAARDGGLVLAQVEQQAPTRLYLPLMVRGHPQAHITAGSNDSMASGLTESQSRAEAISETATKRLYQPVSNRNYPPGPDSPVMDGIDNADRTDSYTVSWQPSNRALYYVLEEDDNPQFSSPTTAYDGTNRSVSRSNMPAGTYYYRVRSVNLCCISAWSAPQNVYVPVPWGIWEIENDTGGTLTLEIYGVAKRDFPPGDHEWEVPAGTHRYGAWSSRCGAQDFDITIPRYGSVSTRFYCRPFAPEQVEVR
jgi:hypothetical protein